MVCGECGATIADRAIVCYRCGAPTETAAAAVRSHPPRRGLPLLGLLVIVVALVLGWLAAEAPADSTSRLGYAIGSVVAFIVGVWLAVKSRGSRS